MIKSKSWNWDIVDKNDFIVISAAFKSGDDCILKKCNISCFVIAGDNKG